jgi:hypothetical protein
VSIPVGIALSKFLLIWPPVHFEIFAHTGITGHQAISFTFKIVDFIGIDTVVETMIKVEGIRMAEECLVPPITFTFHLLVDRRPCFCQNTFVEMPTTEKVHSWILEYVFPTH